MELPKREGGGGSKNFIKLKDGDSATGVFRGELVNFDQHWVAGKGIICEGTAECPYCKQSEKTPAFRFRMNLVINENGAYVAKIFEGSGRTYDGLVAINEELKASGVKLEEHLVKITRHGSSISDTSYQIIPRVNGLLNEGQLGQIAAVKLNSLERKVADHNAQRDDEDEAIPF